MFCKLNRALVFATFGKSTYLCDIQFEYICILTGTDLRQNIVAFSPYQSFFSRNHSFALSQIMSSFEQCEDVLRIH